MVYLVDDDVDDLELVQEALIRNGFTGELAFAENGQIFLSGLSRANVPELVVLDLNMPLTDGFEVLTELKNSRAYSKVPVVILTASHNKADEKRCIALGCDMFFRKPSSIDEYDAIVDAIRNLLQPLNGGSLFTGKAEG